MSHSAFIGQPPLRLPNSLRTNLSTSLPLLTLHTLSLNPLPVYGTTSEPTTKPSPIPFQSISHFSAPPPAPASSKTTILWFRADLRLHDHPALTEAIQYATTGSILPLVIFDPRNYGKTSFGFEKTGRYRTKFFLQSVQNLRQSLRKLGSDLVIRTGQPEQVIPQLAKHTSATAVFCHSEVSPQDVKLESILDKSLNRAGVKFCPLWSNTLHNPEDLPFSLDNLPKAYSTYREQVRAKSKVRTPLSVPDAMPALPSIDPGEIPSLSELGLTDPPSTTAVHQNILGGEAEALNMLSAFVAKASKSKIGFSALEHHTADFSFRISPWLNLGCISPRKMYLDLFKTAPRAKQVTLYFELVWRDFFRYNTVKGAREGLHIPRPEIPKALVS